MNPLLSMLSPPFFPRSPSSCQLRQNKENNEQRVSVVSAVPWWLPTESFEKTSNLYPTLKKRLTMVDSSYFIMCGCRFKLISSRLSSCSLSVDSYYEHIQRGKIPNQYYFYVPSSLEAESDAQLSSSASPILTCGWTKYGIVCYKFVEVSGKLDSPIRP